MPLWYFIVSITSLLVYILCLLPNHYLMHFVHSFPRLQRRCKACWQSIPMSQSSLILFLLRHPMWVLTNCGFLLETSIPCWSCLGNQQFKMASSSVKQLRAEEGSHLNCSNIFMGVGWLVLNPLMIRVSSYFYNSRVM